MVAAQREENIAHFLKGSELGAPLPEFNRVREIILALFALTFAIMLYGVIAKGWWMGQMSALFLGMAIVTYVVAKFDGSTKMDEHTFVDTFVNGARDLLGVALIIGVARGVVVVMDAGKITDTILHAREAALGGLAPVAFINRMLLNQTFLSFVVPSSSGLAVLSMPILAPLSDFAGVARSLVVTAYQSANGWVNLFNPTFAVVMGGLAIGRVSYDRWLRLRLATAADPRRDHLGGPEPVGDDGGRARSGAGTRSGAGELRRWRSGRASWPVAGSGWSPAPRSSSAT